MEKIALITGGTRGIGKEIALELAKNNYSVVINYRTKTEDLLKLEEEVNNLGVQCLLVKADVSNFDECKNMVDTISEKFGRLDVLVNNAGITKDNLILRMR